MTGISKEPAHETELKTSRFGRWIRSVGDSDRGKSPPDETSHISDAKTVRDDRRSADHSTFVNVNPAGLSDSPSAKDEIGFTPYVRALAWFLLNEKTLPPLTLSVEGPWGSGKSSFMLQLKQSIQDIHSARLTPAKAHETETAKRRPDVYCVQFNAWRSDKAEAMWAAFALEFIQQLSREIPSWRRLTSNISLLWQRIDWQAGKLQLVLLGIFSAALLIIPGAVARDPTLVQNLPTSAILGSTWLAAAWAAFKKAKDIFGNPLSGELGKLIRNPKYEEKIAFIERFHKDFSKIVRSYVGENGRVYVFIDDLDRCEVPRAADLMQAINLLLATDQANLFFILGLDREMVAAGLAAKHEKILPYLAASKARMSDSKPRETAMVGIEYGYTFLEKFIQVPFRVPGVQEAQIGRWVNSLTGGKPDALTSEGRESDKQERRFELTAGEDPEGFDRIIYDIAGLFDFNPRRLKQFVNVFRLRVLVALSTNVLAPARPSATPSALSGGVSLEQLGVFTAIMLKWPQLIGDLIDDPGLLGRLSKKSGASPGQKDSQWDSDGKLQAALRLGEQYSLSDIDLSPLFLIMPDLYRGTLSEASDGGVRAHLVAVGTQDTVANNLIHSTSTATLADGGPGSVTRSAGSDFSSARS